ncbi:MAG: hypothetical protein ACODAC_09245, partial [Pseudomonadota bacterium]
MTNPHPAAVFATRRWVTATAVAIALAAIAGCSGESVSITGCEPADDMVPDCRFHNPEDLVVSPTGRFIIVSQFGGMEAEHAGSLAAYAPGPGEVETLFPGADADTGGGDAWGDPACPAPPTDVFSPHGVDIERLDDGRHALYAVNHGGRESVEMFEVLDDEAGIRLAWRGCALAPEDGYFNDVVILENGDFWVSHMFPRDASVLWTALRMSLTGHTPGYVYHWSRADGFRRLPGTSAKFANGVEKSADERFLFLNSYFGDAVVKIDVASGTPVGRAAVSSPDNLSWSPTGELLAASHDASLTDSLACQRLTEGSCGFRFEIVGIEPRTMASRVLMANEGAPMGGA